MKLNRTHSLSQARFDALAAGQGDPAAVQALRSAQRSKHLLLLHAVVDTATRDRPHEAAAAALRSSYDLLAAVQRQAPAVVDAILLHPHVGAWGMHCLGRLRGVRQSRAPLWADLSHLGAIAAAAAVRAGVAFETTVALRDGAVMLPTLGLARTGSRRPWCTAIMRLGTDGLQMIADGTTMALPADLATDSPTWLSLRRLDVTVDGQELAVFLDDIDPLRGCSGLATAPRLNPSSVDAWRRSIYEAWSLLVRHHHDHAAEIAVALTSIVPLEEDGGRHSASAASSDAFGAIAATAPPGGVRLAATLVHEVQHLKLNALLGMFSLYKQDRSDLYYSPWRSDPRPLRSLIQGTYAHLGLADFWLRQRHLATGERAMLGHFELARCREQASSTARWLAASGCLTELGTRFVAGMQATIDTLHRQAVPAEAVELAHDVTMDHRLSWRLRNLRPDPDAVKLLAEAWASGGQCPDMGLPPTTVVPSGRRPDNGRLELLYVRLDDPLRFRRLAGAQPLDEIAPATGPDLAYVSGDHLRATGGYMTAITSDPDDPDPWAGLGLARSHPARDQVATVLLTCPELAFNVHREVRNLTGVAPNPEALSSWLARLCPPTGL